MTIARYEKNMFYLWVFFNMKSHNFYNFTDISRDTIYSVKLMICDFFTDFYYSVVLNSGIYFFNKFDDNFDVKSIVRKNVTT